MQPQHSFVYEENTSGAMYGYCPRCKRYEDECLPNEFHGPIPCVEPPPPAVRPKQPSWWSRIRGVIAPR
ncbi:hypothetical protein FHX34_103511 [Actinoplanes teichomyceticus]|uniref:Uncharacterized protein n=1 Tax=Actinoplanes teichomyceticus TaxID=1867 RepID=A0A561WAU6_ACTTI|nr:hypothetical protein FHX34_103511 [Actinoplanes teichomyceticus]